MLEGGLVVVTRGGIKGRHWFNAPQSRQIFELGEGQGKILKDQPRNTERGDPRLSRIGRVKGKTIG